MEREESNHEAAPREASTLERSLRRSDQMAALASLVSGITHEVRNPLFGISATLDAFEARFGPEGDHTRYLQVLRQQVGRLVELMEELFELGRPTTPSESASLEEVIAAAVEACSASAREGSVAVSVAVGGDLPPVLMDRTRLTSVFRKLVDNAVQHSEPGEEVVLNLGRREREGRTWVRCSIEDRGPGFQEQDLSRVFEPFFTQHRGSTGLGLAISHRVVEDHGGRITVHNREGGGARILVSLPGAAAVETAARPRTRLGAELGRP